VCIPARNEEATIGPCVRAALASQPAVHEVVVYDDASTDRTPDILAEIAAEDPRLRIVRGNGLPDGWVGKPHACHQLSRHADGDVLLFVDADTDLTVEGVARILAMLEHPRLPSDVVTAVPHQVTGTAAERIMMPLLHLVYTAWLPIVMVRLSDNPAFIAANGQVLAVRRAAYDELGGFESVRTEVVDDMAFCRRAKLRGHKVVFADGRHIARCRMYEDGPSLWKGFSKNLYEGIGAHPLALAAVVSLLLGTWVLPWLVLPVALLAGAGTAAAAAGVGAGLGLLTRAMLAARYRHSPGSVLAHPVAVLGLVGIALNSWRWSRLGQIEWAGRTYAAKGQRGAP
jgi:glycosyltransferase involved in cell wall biosynthesis